MSKTGRVFVLGSLNMDIVATANHHPQLGETVLGETLNYYPGGKGLNQAVAAARDFKTSSQPSAQNSSSPSPSTPIPHQATHRIPPNPDL